MKTALAATPAASTPSRVVSSSRVASLPGAAASLFLFILIFSSSSSSKANLVRARGGDDGAAAAAAAAAAADGLPPILPGFGSASASRAIGSGGGSGGGGGGGAKARGDDMTFVRPRAGEDDAAAAGSDLPPILSGFGSGNRVAGGGSSGSSGNSDSSGSSSGSGDGTKVGGSDDTVLPRVQQQELSRSAKNVAPSIAPQGWIALTLTLDDGATSKTVMVKELSLIHI